MKKARTFRCAIYTRKSSEEGLEQSFNSLDAQREACESYIKSQAHEGWKLVGKTYDDGGYSGGSMDRPGLKALLADIDRGQVDIVVVYKVDRLDQLASGEVRRIEQIARREGCDESRVRHLLPLAFLAPDIIERILLGKQPRQVTLDRLLRMELPAGWADQRALLGMRAVQ